MTGNVFEECLTGARKQTHTWCAARDDRTCRSRGCGERGFMRAGDRARLRRGRSSNGKQQRDTALYSSPRNAVLGGLKRMKRLLALVTVLTLVAAPLATRIEAAPAAASGVAVPIVGSGPNGTFAGTLTIQKFVNNAGILQANGVLTGIVTGTNGVVVGSVVKTVSMPVAFNGGSGSGVSAAAVSAQATCDILNLVLGPLHLDLLGLVIDLNQVVLNITAQSGAGNLLGNLLCAVAGLLDGPQTTQVLNQIAGLLNQILGILG
jgi:hypothetical protein